MLSYNTIRASNKENVCTMNVLQGSLQQLLVRFCEAADILCHLREFSETMLANGIRDNDDDKAIVSCQTYQAYSACLRSYLKV